LSNETILCAVNINGNEKKEKNKRNEENKRIKEKPLELLHYARIETELGLMIRKRFRSKQT
jgi:hypothetical protein